MSLEEKDIDAFIMLMKNGNVTRTADALFMSQSTLTKRIQKLEKEYDCTLFLRSKKGMIPTPVAEEILPDLIRMRTLGEKVRDQASTFGGRVGGTLSLGVSVNFARYDLPKILKKYTTLFPNVHLSIQTGQSTALYQKLLDGKLRLIVVRGQFPWKEDDLLLSKEKVFFVCADDRKDTPLSDYPFIARKSDASFQQRINRWIQENEIVLGDYRLEINDISACLALVSEGIGWSILPEICLDSYDGYRKPLIFADGQLFTRETHLLCGDDYALLPQVHAFNSLLA